MDEDRRGEYRKKRRKKQRGIALRASLPQRPPSLLTAWCWSITISVWLFWCASESVISWVKRHEKWSCPVQFSSARGTYSVAITKHSNQPCKRFLCESCSRVADHNTHGFLSACRARYATCSGHPQISRSIHLKHNKISFFRDYQANRLISLDLQAASITGSKVVLKPSKMTGLWRYRLLFKTSENILKAHK